MLRIVLFSAGLFLRSFALTPRCNVTAFDKASENILLYGGGARVPETRAAIDLKCAIERQSLKLAQSFTDRCVKGLAQGMLKMFVDGASNEIDKHCNDGPAKDKYLRLASCINKKAGEEIFTCNKLLAAVLEGTAVLERKKRVPLSCCFMNEYLNCVTKSAGKCGKESTGFAQDIISTYAGDILETVCIKYKPESRECQNLPKVTPIASPRYNTLLPPLAELLASPNPR